MGCACTGTADQYLSCANIPSTRPSRNLLADAMNASGTNPSSRCYVEACIDAEEIIYWKNSPGDCGTQTKVSLGTGAELGKIASFSAFGAGAAAGVAGAVAAGSSASSGLNSAASYIGLAALPFTIWGIFSAHHAQAVATEQATICQVAAYYNGYLAAIKQALQSGQLSLDGAKKALDQVAAQATAGLVPILKSCNFACGVTYAIKGLTFYEENSVFPNLAPSVSKELAGIIPSSLLPKTVTGGIVEAFAIGFGIYVLAKVL